MTYTTQFFQKYRTERETYAIDFAERLDASEVLTGDPTVTVTQQVGDAFEDVTAMFAPLDAVRAETQVQFALDEAATSEDQTRGAYIIAVSIATDALRTLTEVVALIVHDTGDPTG